MKQLLHYLRAYYRDHFRVGYFASLGLFLAVSIWYNYKVDFENTILDSYLHTWQHVVAAFGFYAVPFFFAVFGYAIFYRHAAFLKMPGFWATAFVALLAISLNETFYYQNLYFQQVLEPNTFYFVRKVCNNLVSVFLYLVPVALYWRFFDAQREPFYGFNARNIDLKPYFGMMLIMLPLITWASFQDDFLRMYPTYRFEHDQSEQAVWHFWVYQIFYGMDFVGVELFFRGFLVMALAKYMGAGAIMPMVCMYAYMHFGKPMGETIGSVFGGTVLGVLAYYTRSVYGGIIIHLGVAYMMEFTAFLQTYLRAK